MAGVLAPGLAAGEVSPQDLIRNAKAQAWDKGVAYTSAEGRYTAWFPYVLHEREHKVGDVTVHVVRSKRDDCLYELRYADLAGEGANPLAALERVANNLFRDLRIEDQYGKVSSEQSEHLGVPGFTFQGASKEQLLEVRLYQDGDRNYQLLAGCPRLPAAGATMTQFQSQAGQRQRFFGDFKITSAPAQLRKEVDEFAQEMEASVQPGVRVQCLRKGGDKPYPGVVAARKGRAVTIHYDNGDKENRTVDRCVSEAMARELASPAAKPSPPPAKNVDELVARARANLGLPQPGERVLAQWGKDGLWYPARVRTSSTGATSVVWDDGGETETVKATRPLDWNVGARLQCKWKQDGKYYPGVIATKTGDQIVLKWDEGGEQESMSVGVCRSS